MSILNPQSPTNNSSSNGRFPMFKYTPDGFIDYSELYPLSHEKFPAFEFEKLSLESYTTLGNFLYHYWYLSLVIGAIYMILSFALQHWMRNQQPIKLKWSLFLWNMAIGIFSIIGFCRVVPPLLYRISLPDGFYRSVCVIDPTGDGEFFWALLFGLSKYPELLDTIFVVLRKKPLEAAQWFHHVITIIGATLHMPTVEPYSMHCIAINYGVHSLMYPYFAIKVIGINVPSIVPKIITTCQFAQMIYGFFINLVSAGYYLTGYRYCHRHPYTLLFALIVNVAFIIIFGDVFKRVFSRSSSSKKQKDL